MKTYILSYNGFGDTPASVEFRIGQDANLKVVDRIGDDLVVEGQTDAMKRLVGELNGWFSAPERRIRHPRMRAVS